VHDPSDERTLTVVEPLDRLLWTEEIKQLKARYFRFLDTKDWAGLATVFAPDAVVTMVVHRPTEPPEPRTTVGRDAIVERMRAGVDGVASLHHGHQPEITIESPTLARGIWAMEGLLSHRADARPGESFRRFGYYHDVYRRTADGWLIAESVLRRHWVEPQQQQP
jgi:ketosteroid isomerase-like protein